MITIDNVTATIDGNSVPLVYNAATGLYEAVMQAPSRAGTYTVEFAARDMLGRSATAYTELSVYKVIVESLKHMCLSLLPSEYYLELEEEWCCV